MSAVRDDALSRLCTLLATVGSVDPVLTYVPVTKVVKTGVVTEGTFPPYIVIESVSEGYTRTTSGGIYDRRLRVRFSYVSTMFGGFVETGKIVHHVEQSVGAERTLNGTAIQVAFISNESSVDGQYLYVRFEVEIHYRTVDAVPGTRV